MAKGKCFLSKVTMWVQPPEIAHSRILSSAGSVRTGLIRRGSHTIEAIANKAFKILAQSLIEIFVTF